MLAVKADLIKTGDVPVVRYVLLRVITLTAAVKASGTEIVEIRGSSDDDRRAGFPK